MNTDILSRINTGRENLRQAASELKKHFVGLDDIIDKIVQHIEVWYCLPEIINRPPIVCLWGLTGVGKTDLIRRLTSLLAFTDRYLEVQLTTKDGALDVSQRSLEAIMDDSALESGKPGILLLDEIQRFRSLNEHGEEIYDYRFQDVWSLLSDGRFSAKADAKTQILDLLYQTMYQIDRREDEWGEPITKKKKKNEKAPSKTQGKFILPYWSASSIKRLLGLQEPLTEIMLWDQHRVLEETEKRLSDKTSHPGKDYSKLLIFVSGNIDDAYSMSNATADADVDADLFHEHSKRINFVSIKKALSNRFLPEQVARFGNTHVIYPSLSKASYYEIAERTVSAMLSRVFEYSGVKINVTPAVFSVLYRNGVFPAQGVRPLFSTISSMLESVLPQFVGKALEYTENELTIDYDDLSKEFVCKFANKEVRVYNHGDLDKLRDSQNSDDIYPVAVHEAGHAVVYASLFGLAPTQIAAALSRDEDAGFTGLHSLAKTKNTALDMVCVYLAGNVAETLVLGSGNESLGNIGDITEATTLMSTLARRCGMFERTGLTLNAAASSASSLAVETCYDDKELSDIMESELQTQKKRAVRILTEYRNLLTEVVDNLVADKVILPEKFAVICKKHGVNVEIQSAQKIIRRKKPRLINFKDIANL